MLALVVAAVLIYLPYAEWRYLDRLDLRLLVLGVGGAIAILLAILPRADRFEPPGPVLRPEDHPALFQLIQETATATRQAPPQQVFLVPDLNAWVAERGGVMGAGGERVMGVGLPLLQALTVQEFRAVLAHEFGHYHAGDTALGPWIYTTRAAIGRTLSNLSGNHGFIGKPFEWYGNLFLRITHAVSRDQEYAADALAARIAGSVPLISGLKTIHAAGPAFPAFWVNDVAPALEAGVRPPILEGFQRFLGAPTIAAGVTAHLEAQLADETGDPLDTHPPLRDRIAALASDPLASPRAAPSDDPSAISLMGSRESLEESLVAFLVPPDLGARLTSGTWEGIGEQVWLPRWRHLVSENLHRVKGLRLEQLPDLATPPTTLAVRLKFAATASLASEQHVREARLVTGAVIAVALHRAGFGFTALPGEQVRFTRGSLEVEPFMVMEQLHQSAIVPTDWAALCQAADVAGKDAALLVP